MHRQVLSRCLRRVLERGLGGDLADIVTVGSTVTLKRAKLRGLTRNAAVA
jgi:hypothetical protein